jgi:hypothetical protein
MFIRKESASTEMWSKDKSLSLFQLSLFPHFSNIWLTLYIGQGKDRLPRVNFSDFWSA